MKTFKNILIALLALLLILALGIGYLMLSGRMANPFEQQKQATITAEQVEEQLEKCSDLTTAKLTYKGIVHFTEGQIKYLTKNEFNMQYAAKAVAGICPPGETVTDAFPAGETTHCHRSKKTAPANAGAVLCFVYQARFSSPRAMFS